jgi:hypothetical protein
MSEEADKYFVRIWRPVSVVEQGAMWQAALMHVPSNPRFYLVSPCFGIAKIWKTADNNIYVNVDKCGIDSDGDGNNDASNYCYADEGLIKQYTAIWAASDLGTILTAIGTAGTSTAVKAIVKEADPAQLLQIVGEAAVSWPGYPWGDLTYEKMQTGSQTCLGGEFKENLEQIQGNTDE